MIDAPISEREWQARDDARTLAQAKVIEKDKTRLSAAQTAAQKMADENQKETTALRQVSGRRKRTTTPKIVTKKPNVKSDPTNVHNVFRSI